jgi:Flp pilus assembly protein TadG
MIGRIRTRRPARDAGSVSILLAVGLVAIMAVMALGVDFGGRLRAFARAQALAESAARAGAQQINTGAITGAAATINTNTAPTVACAFLKGTEAACAGTPAVSPDGQTITVKVQITYDPKMLDLFMPNKIDKKAFTVTGTATARLLPGP